MDIGDILDGTIRIYRAAPWTLIGIWGIIVGIPILVQQIAGLYSTELLFATDPDSPYLATEMYEVFESSEYWIANGIIILSLIVWFFTAPLANGSLVYAISELILGRQPGIWESISAVWPKFTRILTAWLYIFGIVIGCIIFALIPFIGILVIFLLIYILIHVMFVTQAVVLDDFPAWNALHRSGNLIKGRALRTAGIYLLVAIMITVIAFGLQQAVTLVDMGLRAIPGMPVTFAIAFGGVLLSLTNIILQPIGSIALTLLYYDLRVRKEGFDMVVLADEVAGYPVGRKYRVPYSASDNKWF